MHMTLIALIFKARIGCGWRISLPTYILKTTMITTPYQQTNSIVSQT
jgi:hypothetical protein